MFKNLVDWDDAITAENELPVGLLAPVVDMMAKLKPPTTVRILGSSRIRVVDGRLNIMSADLETGIEFEASVAGMADMDMLCDKKAMRAHCKLLQSIGKESVVFDGKQGFEAEFPPDDMPEISMDALGLEPQTPFRFNRELVEAIICAQMAVSNDAGRAALRYVFHDSTNGAIVGTDGKRLHIIECGKMADGDCLFKADQMAKICSAKKGGFNAGMVRVGTPPKGATSLPVVEFAFDNGVTFHLGSFGGGYPLYQYIVPTVIPGEFTLGPAETRVVKSFAVFEKARDKQNGFVGFWFDGDGRVVTPRSSVHEGPPSRFEGECDYLADKIAIRPQHLLDVIGASNRIKDTGDITVRFAYLRTPVVFEAGSFKAVVMDCFSNS